MREADADFADGPVDAAQRADRIGMNLRIAAHAGVARIAGFGEIGKLRRIGRRRRER